MITYNEPGVIYNDTNYSYNGFNFFVQNVSDSVSVDENRVNGFGKNVNEIVNITENILKSLIRIYYDTITGSDTTSRMAEFHKMLIDNVGISEVLAKLQNGTSTIWSHITNVTTDWTERTRVSSIWTKRTTQSFYEYNDATLSYNDELRTYNGNSYMKPRTKTTTNYSTRSKPSTSWSGRTKP